MTPEQRNRPGMGAVPEAAGEPNTTIPDPRETGGEGAQLDLIAELEAGRRRRDRGQQIATYATDVAWTHAADRAIADLAASGEPFDAESLRAIVGAPIGSHNAMGPVFLRAARAGLIVRVGSRQATRTEAAGRWIAVWRGTS